MPKLPVILAGMTFEAGRCPSSGSRLAAGFSTAHDPLVPFHLRLRFGPPISPSVTGTWDSSKTAERTFRGSIGRYGSRADVRIEEQAELHQIQHPH
ncbi:hypothetical protein ACWGIU_13560 [Streptomyces sp. NPDC054840]